VGVGKGDRVVIWGASRPEWVAAFFGTLLLGGVVVPLDVRSREDLLTRIEEQTKPVHMILSKEQAGSLKGEHAPFTVMEDLRAKVAELTPLANAEPIVPDDIAELVFTSGTTGNPKGVILTHRNIVANVRQIRTAIQPTAANRCLGLLPLSHMFEQTTGLLVPMFGGSSINYPSSLRPDQIFAVMRQNRITNMSVVPQVLSLFRAGVEQEIRKQGKQEQFARALGIARHVPIFVRRRMFSKVHQRMGGAFIFFVCGGAFLDPALARWWETLGIKVVQGYGMTEASPVVACNTLEERDHDSVGRMLPTIESKLVDGELLVRGENVSPGYWQNPAATAEAFRDGWYRTGDIGVFDKSGRLQLRGRTKNVIVLANGMNVFPEDIERVLTTDKRVKDAIVIGATKGQDVEVHAVLLLQKDVTDDSSTIIRAANAQLGPQQQIRGHTVWAEEAFPMTPTLKVKRVDIIEKLAKLQPVGVGAT
jgi:long-chain acyl-CoA synthetase